MVAVLVYVADMLMRALRKFGRGLLLIGQAYREAQEARRAMPRAWIEE